MSELNMSDFESRFEQRMRRYAAVDVRAIDADALAGSIARRRPRRLPRLAWPAAGNRWLVPAMVALLLLGLVAALAVGAYLIAPRRPAGQTLLVTTGSAYDCQGLSRVDVTTGQVTPVLDCVDRLLVNPNGQQAVARDLGGLALINLENGHTSIVSGTEGVLTEPEAWSPRGTYLYWNEGDLSTAVRPTNTDRIGTLADIRRSDGQPSLPPLCCASPWSADESRVLLLGGDNFTQFIADGDGRNPVSIGTNETFGISPDGTKVLERIPRGYTEFDVGVYDVARGTDTNLTNVTGTTRVGGAAWSSDGRIAVISATRTGTALEPITGTDDLWIYAPDGSTRHLPLTFDHGLAGDLGLFEWSPDGTHVLVGFSGSGSAGIYVVSVTDGSMTAIHGWENATTANPIANPVFSPDGSMLASFTGANGEPGLHIFELDGSAPRTIDNLEEGPWTQLLWVP